MRTDIMQQAQAIRASMDATTSCTRGKCTGEAARGTVVLQYLPHELVGHYFVKA